MRYFVICMVPFFLLGGCDPETPTPQPFPIIRTLAPTDIDESGVTFRAEATSEGDITTRSYGFIWATGRNPDISSASGKVIVGDVLDKGTFEKRIDHQLARGLTYYVKAFATYDSTVVYSNDIVFKSKGSLDNPWALEADAEYQFEGWLPGYGSSTENAGYVLFNSAEFYVYDPDKKSFSRASSIPISSSDGKRFTSVSLGKTQYFFNSIDRNLYRFENGKWSVESTTPFFYGSFDGYYHGHVVGNEIYILSSYRSYSYNVVTHSWQERTGMGLNDGYSYGGVSMGDKAYLLDTKLRIWEYDPTTNGWTLETEYPGSYRYGDRIMTFAKDGKIYFGLPHYYYIDKDWMATEFWSYDPLVNKWKELEPFPIKLDFGDMLSFALRGKLFIGYAKNRGHYALWSFDPSRLN